MAEHDHCVAPGNLVLINPKPTSYLRLYTKDLKKAAAHQGPEFHLRQCALLGGKAERPELGRGQSGEGMVAVAEIFVIRVRHIGVFANDPARALAPCLR